MDNKKAIEFTLKNTNGEDVSLKDVIKDSNVVLLFFPLAFSSVCTKELCDTRDNLKMYEELNAKIIGISTDSFFTLKAFKKSNNLNFTLLSDFNKEVSESYHVLYEDFYGMKGVTKRAAFVIDQEGKIRYQEVLDDAGQLPDFEEIRKTLQDIEE